MKSKGPGIMGAPVRVEVAAGTEEYGAIGEQDGRASIQGQRCVGRVLRRCGGRHLVQ